MRRQTVRDLPRTILGRPSVGLDEVFLVHQAAPHGVWTVVPVSQAQGHQLRARDALVFTTRRQAYAVAREREARRIATETDAQRLNAFARLCARCVKLLEGG